MSYQQQLDEVQVAIAAIQPEIAKAKGKLEKAEERLEKAIVEGNPADIRADLNALLQSATAELTSLCQEEFLLMEKKRKLTPPATNNLMSTETPEMVIARLKEMIKPDVDGKENIFKLQESTEYVDLKNSVLKINIKSIDGIPDFLYSEEIYDDEKELKIEMPVDKLHGTTHKTIVLIGVSGCGKTRTCYDLCRLCWGLYFDCVQDADFNAMTSDLLRKSHNKKKEANQEAFEALSTRLIECLIAVRLLVLQTLQEGDQNLQGFDWLCIQRSRRSQSLFSAIFDKLSKLPWLVWSNIYVALEEKFDGRVIFDESQLVLDLLSSDYRSSRSGQRNINPDGSFAFPRPFFSFLSQFIIKSNLKSIWCGTQMRIRNMDLMYSAAGIKPGNIHIFTDFNFLKPTHIFNLMSKWLKVDIAKNLSLYEEISNILQGRPRFFMSFLHRLIDSSDVEGCFRRYVRDMTTNYDSSLSSTAPYFFWEERIHWTIEPINSSYSPAFEVKFVSETLIKLCLVFLFGDGSSVAYSPNFDLVSTGLVMISKDSREWWATMAEPIVLAAGLNYMADVDGQLLMKYFASQLFSAVGMLTLTPAERGHMMKLFVTLRFMQEWWLDPALNSYLPKWAQDTEIRKPDGILDCRSQDSGPNMLLQQLLSREFPCVVLPLVNAGPDLRYSVFCCCIKTTWTSNSQSTCYVTVDEC
ncbi:hypothetical protein MP638_004532 [Amoeboaphelidium occidentale]|nr:hypothetical protein MP638_004532 [Amoeboaphelidium occidentale]